MGCAPDQGYQGYQVWVDSLCLAQGCPAEGAWGSNSYAVCPNLGRVCWKTGTLCSNWKGVAVVSYRNKPVQNPQLVIIFISYMSRLGRSITILIYSPVVRPLATCCFSGPCSSTPSSFLLLFLPSLSLLSL